MSYEIIKHKFLLTFTEPEALSASYTTARIRHELYVSFESSNNVDPRTYDGRLFANTTAHETLGHITNTPILPRTLWEWAYYAEDGMHKIYPNRNITGIGWIQSWQKIIRRPIPLADESGRLCVMPTLSFSFGEMHLDAMRSGNTPVFPSHPAGLADAWESLIHPALVRRGEKIQAGFLAAENITITDTTELTQALLLMSWAKDKNTEGFNFSLKWDERQGEQLQRIFDRIPEPETQKPIRLEAGMQIAYGKRTYTLDVKIKQSWHVTRDDGAVFRMGPKQLKYSTILHPAAA